MNDIESQLLRIETNLAEIMSFMEYLEARIDSLVYEDSSTLKDKMIRRKLWKKNEKRK
jgi:hypothetical protein